MAEGRHGDIIKSRGMHERQKSGMRGWPGKPVMVIHRCAGHASVRVCIPHEGASRTSSNAVTPSMSPPSSYREGITRRGDDLYVQVILPMWS